jgi:hypothetical protein
LFLDGYRWNNTITGTRVGSALHCELATFSTQYDYFCSVKRATNAYSNYLFNYEHVYIGAAPDHDIVDGVFARSTSIAQGKEAVVSVKATPLHAKD